MASIDFKYHEILRRILDEGIDKGDRTGTGTRSIFSHTLEYDMKDGFPLITTKKMFTKGIVTELLWFLNGDTNLRHLLEHNNKIWVGDAYKKYEKSFDIDPNNFDGEEFSKGHDAQCWGKPILDHVTPTSKEYKRGQINAYLEGKAEKPFFYLTKEEFIEKIKSDDDFNNKWGDLGPIYGKQWVNWGGYKIKPSVGWLHKKDGIWCIKYSDLHSYSYGTDWSYINIIDSDQSKYNDKDEDRKVEYKTTTIDYNTKTFVPNQVASVVDSVPQYTKGINQIQQAIDALNNNPDSRRIMVSAWNPAEISEMILPPCHWAFELYTEEMAWYERAETLGFMEGEKEYFRVHMIKSEGNKFNLSVDDSFDEVMDKMGVPKRKISLKWHQRSVDVPLGLPFNIASYAFLLEMFAQQCNMVPDKLIGDLTNVHIYQNQLDGVREQLDRSFDEYEAPKLNLFPRLNFHERSLLAIKAGWKQPYHIDDVKSEDFDEYGVTYDKDIFNYSLTDFRIEGYESYPTIKYPLSN